MASGSQNMTTYNARTVTGSNSAASPAGALLLSGAGRADNATGDTWIFLDSHGGTSAPWGIKHDQANNKIHIYGNNTDSVWTRMNTGDTYILGKVGIGYDPETSGNTYKLYVNGTSYFTNNLTMNGGTITLWGERYNGNYGLDCNNSDIVNINSLRTADNAETYGEGLMFKNGSAWDCMAASGGTFYFRSATDGTPALSNANSTANLRCNLVNNWHFDTVSSLNANDVRTTNGMWACAASITNAAMTNHSVLFGASNVGTPFQLQIPDSSHLYIYKRWYSSGAWSGWTKIYAGYADSAGSVAWDNVTGKPSTFPPSSHSHSYLPLSGGTMTGNISFSNSGTGFRGINYGTMGDNDQWRIGGAATGSNAGYMEIATADDGTEPIYVRQYTGVFSSLKRTLTLLDASGNTTFPGSLYLNNRGTNIIYNGPNDNAYGVGGALNNLVISSWWGVSFTTSCGGQTYSNTNAVTINCRNGHLYAAGVHNAVWNDLGESRKSIIREPGYAIAPSGARTSTRLEPGARIISDTYGFLLGDENDMEKAPIAIAGRVLAYSLHDKSYYEVGDAVCAAEGGKIDKMTREEIKEYPDRIIGIVNEIPDYDIWEPSLTGGGREPVHTNGRIWIDVR